MNPKLSQPTESHSMASVVINVPQVKHVPDKQPKGCSTSSSSCSRVASLLKKVNGAGDIRWVIHGTKVGLALLLVSLLYMLEVVHDRLGDNAMWAVMTVVVVFEFTAGATISKGLNRGAGTILGGGLGTSVALLAQEIGGIGRAVAIGTSVFIFGALGTYTRMVPNFKKKYDYGAMIFILTFSLVTVSGVRGGQIIEIATDRLSSICMGFAISVFISLVVFPMWAGDELHSSLVSKFKKLARSIEECLENCDGRTDKKSGTQPAPNASTCLSILSMKTKDETLANFAKWEPWHGRFGFYYPWNKYLEIGGLLGELAASIHLLRECLVSKRQPLATFLLMEDDREQCEAACSFLASVLRELGNNIHDMKQSRQQESILAKFMMLRSELCSSMLESKLAAGVANQNGTVEGGVVSAKSAAFLLLDVLDKTEVIAKEAQELGRMACFANT